MFEIHMKERIRGRKKGKKDLSLRLLPTFWMLMIPLVSDDFFAAEYGYLALDWVLNNWILFALNFSGVYFLLVFSCGNQTLHFPVFLAFLLLLFFHSSSQAPSQTFNIFVHGYLLHRLMEENAKTEGFV